MPVLDTFSILKIHIYLKKKAMNFGRKFKYFRRKKGLSQKEIAHHINVSQKTLSNIENDKYDIRLKNFIKLSMKMGFDPCDFIKDPSSYLKKPTNQEESFYIKTIYLKKEVEHYKTLIKNKNEIILLLKEKLNRISS